MRFHIFDKFLKYYFFKQNDSFIKMLASFETKKKLG
jgi:hypothetical protein